MNNRRKFLLSSVSAGLMLNFPVISLSRQGSAVNGAPINRIAFGSCVKSWKPQDIWSSIIAAEPDLFLFLGDTIYADEGETKRDGIIDAFKNAYKRLNEVKAFRQFRNTLPVLATWDDHDYGPRESGAEFSQKEVTRQLFLDFWQIPENDKRRWQTGGIYGVYEYGSPEKRVQIILLDTRYGRSPLIELPEAEFKRRKLSGFGPYLPNKNAGVRFLGDAQWQWLEAQLRRPALIRFVCSSVPFAAGFRGWESWANFPLERARFINLIRRTKANGVIFLSGDIHYGDLSCETSNVPYPLWDLTSSGFTHFWPTPGPNSNRVYANTIHERNFGLVHILWQSDNPLVVLEIRNVNGDLRLQHTLRLESLSIS